ncbi:hypothetical protein CY658_00960 [Variovorax sp. RO1]|uniref:copper chaperone PCu(A)C n=1 Tax=Variovorax sp. RO1 TaxID=2066034 RepID=UPI000C7188A4|nr:hypothetical protein CY658_00960 [Variovorax sp. RO1]
MEARPRGVCQVHPRGLHLMLMTRLQSLSVGDRMPMTFLFSDGQRLQTVFRAVPPSAH